MTRIRPPTMLDVARLAGVSPMTVSRALRPGGSVSAATRARIQEAAERLGYVPDGTAAGLSSKRSGFVAATVPSIDNANFADTVRGLTDALRETGLQVLLAFTDYNTGEEARLVETLLRRRPEAVVLTGGNHTERCRRLLSAAGVPVIETWDIPARPIQHAVGFSNARAGRMVARHLHRQGFERIGFIGGDENRDTRGAERLAGFREYLEENDLPRDRLWPGGTPPVTMARGRAAMADLLAAYPDTQAVMGVSDLAAFGAMTECHRRGLSVPGDIAIAGFGAYEIADNCVPDLTTVDVGAYGIGLATGKLIQGILGGAVEPNLPHIKAEEPRLLVRGSTVPDPRTG